MIVTESYQEQNAPTNGKSGRTVHQYAKQVFEDQARDMVDGAKRGLASVDRWVQNTVREHPYLVLVNTVAAGLLGGLLMRRRYALGTGMAAGFLLGCYHCRQGEETVKSSYESVTA